MEQFSNSAINKAGDAIRQGESTNGYNEAIQTLNAWREQHGVLMDEYYDKCRELLKQEEFRNILVAQRLKRLPTILDKLKRLPDMQLSRLQDVAGVRIVVRDIEQLEKVERILSKWPNLERRRDYITNPKPDGYRGMHFIYKKDNLRVELQLRTQIQHVWATSVETVDVLKGTNIKTGGKNRTYWNDFFRLSSMALGVAESHPEAERLSDICEKLSKLVSKHCIEKELEACEVAYHASKHPAIGKNAYYLVLNLDFEKHACHIDDFKEAEYIKAIARYQELELKNTKTNTVLVAVNDIKKLEDLYPNYFLDVCQFRETIMFMLAKGKKGY